jgi:hypothetical protein
MLLNGADITETQDCLAHAKRGDGDDLRARGKELRAPRRGPSIVQSGRHRCTLAFKVPDNSPRVLTAAHQEPARRRTGSRLRTGQRRRRKEFALKMSCGMDCDATLDDDAVGAPFTGFDAREPCTRKSLIPWIFTVLRRRLSICRVTATNQEVAPSSRAGRTCRPSRTAGGRSWRRGIVCARIPSSC